MPVSMLEGGIVVVVVDVLVLVDMEFVEEEVEANEAGMVATTGYAGGNENTCDALWQSQPLFGPGTGLWSP